MRGPGDYRPLLVDLAGSSPQWATDAQAVTHQLVADCAFVFASNCNIAPAEKFPRDAGRRPTLRYGRGLAADEAAGFLRAKDAGLVTVQPDGAFYVPAARACSTNLHLVGRNEDHVTIHTEVLIHVTAFAELVLDKGWDPECIVFDPFIRGAALDLWGFDAPRRSAENWWDGRIRFVAEAKARVMGADGLSALAAAFERLQRDPTAVTAPGHRRKWRELTTIVSQHGSIEVLLVADGARWWYDATPDRRAPSGLRLVRRT